MIRKEEEKMSAVFGKEGYRFVEINAVKTIFGLSVLLPFFVIFKFPIQLLVFQATNIFLTILLLIFSRLIGSLIIEIVQELILLPLLRDIFSSTTEKRGYNNRDELRLFPPHKMWKDKLFKKAREEIIILSSLLATLIILIAIFNIASLTPFSLDIPDFIDRFIEQLYPDDDTNTNNTTNNTNTNNTNTNNDVYNDLAEGLKGYALWINVVFFVLALPVVILLYRAIFTSYADKQKKIESLDKRKYICKILSFYLRHCLVLILPIIILLVDYRFYNWLLNRGYSNTEKYFVFFYVGFILGGIILYFAYLRSYFVVQYSKRKIDLNNNEKNPEGTDDEKYFKPGIRLELENDSDADNIDLNNNEKNPEGTDDEKYFKPGIRLELENDSDADNIDLNNNEKNPEGTDGEKYSKSRKVKNIISSYHVQMYITFLLILLLVGYIVLNYFNLPLLNEEREGAFINLVLILMGIPYLVYFGYGIYNVIKKKNSDQRSGKNNDKNEVNSRESLHEEFVSFYFMYYNLLEYKAKNIKLESDLFLISAIHVFSLLSSTYVYDVQEKAFFEKAAPSAPPDYYVITEELAEIPNYAIATRLFNIIADNVTKNNFDAAMSFFLSSLKYTAIDSLEYTAIKLVSKLENIELITHIFKVGDKWENKFLLLSSILKEMNERAKLGQTKFLKDTRVEIKKEYKMIKNVFKDKKKGGKMLISEIRNKILNGFSLRDEIYIEPGFLKILLKVTQHACDQKPQPNSFMMLTCDSFYKIFVI